VRITRVLIALALVSLIAPGLLSFSFEPITQTFDPSGEGANHVFRVTNTTTERIAVRISVRPRRIEPDGTEVQGKESDDFVVYPRQMLLDPGDRRSVRVAWRGTDSPTSELAFRIIAEQLPVNLGAEQSTEGGTIVLTYRYEGSIYVMPPGARPSIQVTSVEETFSAGEPALGVTIENSGTRHGLLSQARLDIATRPDGDPAISLGPEDLPGLSGENMLAGSVRRFFVPVPAELPDGPLYAQIRIDEE
jgi:fimbrial chaperone protein